MERSELALRRARFAFLFADGGLGRRDVGPQIVPDLRILLVLGRDENRRGAVQGRRRYGERGSGEGKTAYYQQGGAGFDGSIRHVA